MAIGADKVRRQVTLKKDDYEQIKRIADAKGKDAAELMREYIKCGMTKDKIPNTA